jgi:Fe2+ or Zn2+ uptake regulation protein
MNSLAYDILAYLNEHGDAQDTVEGIAEWWLMRQSLSRYASSVEETLDGLVEAGLVLRQRTGDSRVLYQLNRRKAQEVRRLLAQQPGRPEP